MPYARRKKKYDLRKRRSYRSRLSDKKINTAIEKKIQAIARREDNKNRNFGIHQRKLLATPTSEWDTAYSRPDTSAQIELTPNTLYSQMITGASANFINETNTNNTTAASKTNVYAKTFQACLAFQNYSQNEIAVRIALIAVPRNTHASSQNEEPVAQDQPYTNIQYKGIFKRGLHSFIAAGVVPFKTANRVIATKRIMLRPTRSLYDVKGSTVDDEITKSIREVTLTKNYKSRGKKLTYNVSQVSSNGSPADNENVFLCVTTNAENTGATIGVRMWGVAGFKYTIGQATQKQPYP